MLLSSVLMLIISIGTLLIGVWTIVIAWKQFCLRKECESHLLHVASYQAELVLLIENQQQLLKSQETIENTIDIATTTVRTIHKGIAAIPFGILEAIPTTRHTTKAVRITHDLISDAIYSSIKITNKASGKLIRRSIGKNTTKRINQDDPGAP